MTGRLFGILGAAGALALAISCKDDPTASLAGGIGRVGLDFDYLEVIIGDSVRVNALARDRQETPVPAAITITSCNPAVARIVAAPPEDPQLRKGFFVRGVTFGATCVVAAAGRHSDTMNVATFPDSLVILGPDTVLSGAVVSYAHQYRDAAGNAVGGVPAPTWEIDDASHASVNAAGAVTGKAPGAAVLTATGTGSPEDGIAFELEITVVPGVFAGTVNPTSGDPTDAIVITRDAAGPVFDADTRVTFDGVRAFVSALTADEITVAVPPTGVAGPVELALVDMGPDQVAQGVTFTSNTASFADPYDGVNDDPATSPEITANGDYYVVLHGACADGVGGADCDDWFKITNTSGSTVTVSVNAEWFTGADIDALQGSTPATILAFDCEDGCSGATPMGNPESTSIDIPAGATYYLLLNLWDAHGEVGSLTRVRVSGLP